MSVLQRITQSAITASSSILVPIIENSVIPIIENKISDPIIDNRILFVCSRSLAYVEIISLKQHGSVLEYSSSLFSAVMDLTNVKFDYLVFDLTDKCAKEWISTNLTNLTLRIVLIKNSYESDIESWMTAIPHLNIIKKVPSLNINKADFEAQIMKSVHIPHTRGLGDRFFQKIFSCCAESAVEIAS